eukprot:CAMPEP_0198299300 /NCGR_PEP_ID=MMETSP1449-20131203/44208_1 /TAXON_ID=420275 /ORGANISM="Attheya septentrionalis, Strain CCMP2084" /LENGTH=35 /DNA_ID= /DNA_START= /DNA_END= /DNA_ORIENTATION=
MVKEGQEESRPPSLPVPGRVTALLGHGLNQIGCQG